MSEHGDPRLPPDWEKGNMGWEMDTCVICGKWTSRAFIEGLDELRDEGNKEPFVCNKCLVDMRGDMATELEVRRQLSTLEAKVEGLGTRQWILGFAFSLAFAALTFIAGLWLGSGDEPDKEQSFREPFLSAIRPDDGRLATSLRPVGATLLLSSSHGVDNGLC